MGGLLLFIGLEGVPFGDLAEAAVGEPWRRRRAESPWRPLPGPPRGGRHARGQTAPQPYGAQRATWRRAGWRGWSASPRPTRPASAPREAGQSRPGSRF
eukprot:scaffold131792_cov20-Tisochrysis_lutea.AAC.2